MTKKGNKQREYNHCSGLKQNLGSMINGLCRMKHYMIKEHKNKAKKIHHNDSEPRSSYEEGAKKIKLDHHNDSEPRSSYEEGAKKIKLDHHNDSEPRSSYEETSPFRSSPTRSDLERSANTTIPSSPLKSPSPLWSVKSTNERLSSKEPTSSLVSSSRLPETEPPKSQKDCEQITEPPSVPETLPSQNQCSPTQCPDSAMPDSPKKTEGFTSHFNLNETEKTRQPESSDSSSTDDEVTIIEAPPRNFIPTTNRLIIDPVVSTSSFPKYFRIQILNLDPEIKYNEVKTVVVDLGIEPKNIVDLLLMNDREGSLSTISFDKEHSMITALSYNGRITHRGRTLTIRNYDPSWVDAQRGEPVNIITD